jgi:hypothetical protein
MEDLLAVFLHAREALSHPKNDFVWSSWRDADEALREIDGVIAKLRSGQLPDELKCGSCSHQLGQFRTLA